MSFREIQAIQGSQIPRQAARHAGSTFDPPTHAFVFRSVDEKKPNQALNSAARRRRVSPNNLPRLNRLVTQRKQGHKACWQRVSATTDYGATDAFSRRPFFARSPVHSADLKDSKGSTATQTSFKPATSPLGGWRAYRCHIGKDRSPRPSRHSIRPRNRFHRPFETVSNKDRRCYSLASLAARSFGRPPSSIVRYRNPHGAARAFQRPPRAYTTSGRSVPQGGHELSSPARGRRASGAAARAIKDGVASRGFRPGAQRSVLARRLEVLTGCGGPAAASGYHKYNGPRAAMAALGELLPFLLDRRRSGVRPEVCVDWRPANLRHARGWPLSARWGCVAQERGLGRGRL